MNIILSAKDISLLAIFIGSLIILFILDRINEQEKRFSKFTVLTIKDESVPLFDKLIIYFNKFISSVSNCLVKIKIFNKYSKKYEKYSNNPKVKQDLMDYISLKVIFAFIGFISFLLYVLINNLKIEAIYLLFSILVAFFTPDIIYMIKSYIWKKKVEKDLFKAILILNNSFKAGLNIMQAIHRVYKELDGEVSREFELVYRDINFGLSMDIVFNRFAERLNSKDAKYIATSLIIASRTGGNLVTVFDFATKNSFVRKNLDNELKAVISSAVFIYRFLIIIPVALFFIIFILNPTYFNPLFNTDIGLFVLFIIMTLYGLYVYIVRRFLKVEVL